MKLCYYCNYQWRNGLNTYSSSQFSWTWTLFLQALERGHTLIKPVLSRFLLLPSPTRGDWHWSVNLCTPSFPARMTNTICMAVPWKQLLGKQYSCWWPGPWARMVSWGRAFQDLETSADTASPSAPTKRQPFSRWPKFCFLSIRSWPSMCLFLLILLPH